jgi:hypothetical protein
MKGTTKDPEYTKSADPEGRPAVGGFCVSFPRFMLNSSRV